MPITCQKLDECYYKFTFSCLLYGFASSTYNFISNWVSNVNYEEYLWYNWIILAVNLKMKITDLKLLELLA